MIHINHYSYLILSDSINNNKLLIINPLIFSNEFYYFQQEEILQLKKRDAEKVQQNQDDMFKAAPEAPKRESVAERRLRKEVRLDFVEIIFDYITITFDSHKLLFVFNPVRFYQ